MSCSVNTSGELYNKNVCASCTVSLLSAADSFGRLAGSKTESAALAGYKHSKCTAAASVSERLEKRNCETGIKEMEIAPVDMFEKNYKKKLGWGWDT